MPSELCLPWCLISSMLADFIKICDSNYAMSLSRNFVLEMIIYTIYIILIDMCIFTQTVLSEFNINIC